MKKVYACSDLHSCGNLWKAIANYCGSDDTIIFLGDGIDRGPDGLKLFFNLLKDKRVIYLLGNHEILLSNAIDQVIKIRSGLEDEYYNDYYGDIALWIQNGGNMADLYVLAIDDLCKIQHKIKNLPIFVHYKNKNNKTIFLNHAGGSPDKITKWEYNLKTIEDDLSKTKIFSYYNKEALEKILWNREHISEEWSLNPKYKDLIIIHGHTPVQKINNFLSFEDQYLAKNNNPNTIVKYCHGHKIDIDTGCYFTGIATLLDLDTLEPIYFTERKLKQ